MSRMALIGACLVLALSTTARSQDVEGFKHIWKEAPVTLQSDKAYLLMRMPKESLDTRTQPMFLRKPSKSERRSWYAAKLKAHADAGKKRGPIEEFRFEYKGRPNFFQLDKGREYTRDGKDRTYLIIAEPGEYVLYGLGFNKYLWQCNCLGTVSFTAKQGIVTDLGTILLAKAWEISKFPELADDTGLGKKMRQDYFMYSMGVRPPSAQSDIPAQIAALSVEPAEYRAEGSFVEPARLLANRLAPVPGVLEYRNGLATDSKTGDILR